MDWAKDIPGWRESEADIASALRRMCDLMGAQSDEGRLETLQQMADALLDRSPASSATALEHRLRCLCRAIEMRGPYAAPETIVDLAAVLSARLH